MKVRTVTVFILLLIIPACLMRKDIFMSGWKYNNSITITNSAKALIDYQVFVPSEKTNISNLISQGKMLSNLNDVRFVDGDGTTILNYWIDNSMGELKGFWVKVPNIPAEASKKIYIYYGNPSAYSVSSGSATFDFFDDFSSYPENSNGSPAWAVEKEWSIQNGVLYHQGNTRADYHVAHINNFILGDFAMDCRWRWDGGVNDFISFDFRDQNPNLRPCVYNYLADTGRMWGELYTIVKTVGNMWAGYDIIHDSCKYTANRGAWIKVRVEAVGHKIKTVFDNKELHWTDTADVWYSTGSAGFIANYNASWSVDDVRIRKLVYPEPVISVNHEASAATTTENPASDIVKLSTCVPIIRESSLVGYWKFDEGTGDMAHDSSGNGNDGRIHGATWGDGIEGKALQFDGIDDFVDIANESNFDFEWNQPITIEAWVNLKGTALNLGYSIFSKQSLDPQLDYIGYMLNFFSHTKDPFNPGTIHLEYYVYNNTVAGKRLNVMGETDLIPYIDSWHHVAVTYDGSGMWQGSKIYIDGLKTGSIPYQDFTECKYSMLNNVIPNIGGREGLNNFFNGFIDEVKVYNCARTAGQISKDAGGISGIITGDKVNIRKSPTISNSEVIDQVDKGTKVIILGKSNTPDNMDNIENYWYWVKLENGKEGWVFGQYIKTTFIINKEK